MNPSRLAHLAMKLFNVPLALRPDKADLAMALAAKRLGLRRIVRSDGAPIAARLGTSAEASTSGAPASGRPGRGYDTLDGIAIVRVHGLLVQRSGLVRPFYGITGMDGIRQNLFEAIDDPSVRAIVLDVDSPGGEVAGCFDLADTIHRARGIKPLQAICAEHAYSAAYAIASACDRVTVPRTGGTGSVGVITLLVDWATALDGAGIAVHFVHHGARKAEEMRAELQGVSKDLLGRIQTEVDRVGELFVATVARNRGIAAERIRDQQAACFMGELGVQQGLADAVAAPSEAFEQLLSDLRRGAVRAGRGARAARRDPAPARDAASGQRSKTKAPAPKPARDGVKRRSSTSHAITPREEAQALAAQVHAAAAKARRGP